MGSEPGQQGGVFNAGLAPEVHHRELARAEDPGKGLRTHPQPALRFGEGDQLRRRGELQGKVLLPCRGRCPTASRWRWHTQGFPSQGWGDSMHKMC
jgi:hypothetical protein